MAPAVSEDTPEAAKRRSQRVLLSVPVVVQAQMPGGVPREEETRTLVVNAHGALIRLTMRAEFGQSMLLRNQTSHEEQRCRVVFVGHDDSAKTQVGVEFIQPAPRFWGIRFPPEDWTPQSPGSRIQKHI